MTRSSSRLFSIALVALGAVLGFLVAVKAPEFLQSDSPAPVISSRSPASPAHPYHPHEKNNFLEAVRLTGSVGSGGWKGDATWTGKHGSTLSLGSTISQNGVEEVGATAGYKSHDWHRVPDLEVGASMKPGKPGVAYSAKMSKVLDGSLEPTVSAQLTNSGWSLGTSFSKELKDGVDMEMDLKMPISVSGNSSEVDLVVDGKATYKVKGGKLVGTLGGKASSGLRGVSYGMSYDLGL
eukprot:CAMPEP_0175405486 /NCGR_PEP_ID=MMETSP0095-20121207/39077_1 /TAXON_ID=311494 /ORGANISM="Alexandrium monilatum, Strain CCMP3105" /LENGTH=236 /DNA_ID=CAMNT_0016704325 /DNA_START=17 /DNA_END=727 /DNA_ORIENTATION=-